MAMPKALPNPTSPLFALNEDTLQLGKKASRESPRLRIIFPVQRSQEARVQRLLNFMQPGTYIQPHCHPEPHASESLSLISGELELLIFSEGGDILSRHLLNKDSPLIDIEPGVWHGMIVREEDTVIFEVKQGPYDPNADKHFASWAPTEGDAAASDYLASL